MKNFCAFCEHYIGGGDWNLCCRQWYELCYADTEACEKFKEDPTAKRAFSDGIRMYKAALKNKKPVTNYDLLVSKSPEELAKWLEQNTHYQNGDMPWEYWLKREVEE